MKFAVVNTPAKIGPSGWANCWKSASQRGSIFGQNEILGPRQKSNMIDLCRRHGVGQYGVRQCPNPIYWDQSKWRRVRGKVHRIHSAGSGWQAKRWPGYNSARTINEVVLQRRGGRRRVAVLNTHWAPPAGVKVPRGWRKRVIRQSKKLLRKLVRKHLKAGRLVLVMGDFNLKGEFKMPEGFRWLSSRFIDKVGIGIPDQFKTKKATGGTFPAPTDHRHGGVWGQFRVKRK